MERHAIIIDGWPALMSVELATRYLSIDEATFRGLMREYRLETVEPRPDVQRWRKTDLDRLAKRLPANTSFSASNVEPVRLVISDADVERIAQAIARQRGTGERGQPPELMSIKDASRLLGLSRTTVYNLINNLINEGRLQTRQIGRRRLVPRSSIQAILADQGPRL